MGKQPNYAPPVNLESGVMHDGGDACVNSVIYRRKLDSDNSTIATTATEERWIEDVSD